MTTMCDAATGRQELQLATFRAGAWTLAIAIDQVQEINRRIEATFVPHAPPSVRGVMNLRGEVVTVIDLRTALGLGPAEATRHSRNVVVYVGGELVGLWVDQMGDILTIDPTAIAPPPPHLAAVDRRFVAGVYATDDDLVLLLNVEHAVGAL